MIFSLRSTLKSLIVFLALFSNQSFATWYQGSAQQKIGILNFETIRTETIKHAIANAAMQSNSYIQVEDIVLDGLLESSKTVLRSEGNIRRVKVLSESINNDILSIIVNVDIKPLFGCQSDPYAKSLLLTQFPLLTPNQAVQGAIFDIGIQASRRFEMQLNSQESVYVSSLLNKAFMPDDSLGTINTRYLKDVGSYLATEHDSQFILFGAIRDISLFEQVKDQLLIDDVLLRRNFTFQIYLYDAIKGKLLIQKSYHGEANWQYKENHMVDTNNSVFWRSDYGRTVLHTINSAVIDINDELSCQQSLPQIIHSDNGKLVINIGEEQGVKVGDEFELVKQQFMQGINGKAFPLSSVDTSKTLKVIQVNNQTAVLTSDWLSTLDGSLVQNLVRPKSSF
jgi:hypothetical protein